MEHVYLAHLELAGQLGELPPEQQVRARSIMAQLEALVDFKDNVAVLAYCLVGAKIAENRYRAHQEALITPAIMEASHW